MMKSSVFVAALLHALNVAAVPAPQNTIITNYYAIETITEYGHTGTRTSYIFPQTTPSTGITSFTVTDEILKITVVQVQIPAESRTVSTTSTEDSSPYTRSSYDDYYYTRGVQTGPTTRYFMNVTYTPLPTCTEHKWTLTTSVPIYLSSSAQATLPAITTQPYIYSQYPDYAIGTPTPVTGVDIFIDATAISPALYTSLSSSARPYMMTYCYVPNTSCTLSTRTVTQPATSTTVEKICTPTFISPLLAKLNDSFDRRQRSLDTRIIIIAVVAGVFVFLLIIGMFYTSYKYFAAMMCGLARKRGVPMICCLCVPCTMPCAGPRWKARSVEDQRVLRERWEGYGVGERLGLWLKWGFRWKYPVELLGEDPGRMGKAGVNDGNGEGEVVEIVRVDAAGKERV